ncbi:MAG: hypothetical protein RLY43_2165 [Bacteroidota bacterium]|jgi:hypothetical protein
MILFTFSNVKVGQEIKVAHFTTKTTKTFTVVEVLGKVGDYTKVKVA